MCDKIIAALIRVSIVIEMGGIEDFGKMLWHK